MQLEGFGREVDLSVSQFTVALFLVSSSASLLILLLSISPCSVVKHRR